MVWEMVPLRAKFRLKSGKKGSFICVSRIAPKMGLWHWSQLTKGRCLSESFRPQTFQKRVWHSLKSSLKLLIQSRRTPRINKRSKNSRIGVICGFIGGLGRVKWWKIFEVMKRWGMKGKRVWGGKSGRGKGRRRSRPFKRRFRRIIWVRISKRGGREQKKWWSRGINDHAVLWRLEDREGILCELEGLDNWVCGISGRLYNG